MMAAAARSQCEEIFESSLQNVLPKFELKEFKDEQALFHLVSENDVFVNLSAARLGVGRRED